MVWKVAIVQEQRQALCYQIAVCNRPVTEVCREFGVSRKTAYKWLAVYRRQPGTSLADRSRRPKSSPRQTSPEVEQAVLALRDKYNWGGRKIRRVLLDRRDSSVQDLPPGTGVAPTLPAPLGFPPQQRQALLAVPETTVSLPSVRTVSAVLRRAGRVGPRPEPVQPKPWQHFERPGPNELWQLDHKGPIEIARQKHYPLTVVDDHSRFCLCFQPLPDTTHERAWTVLWEVFGHFGMPEGILCDGAFAARGLGISWFEQQLIRLNIKPVHGRPYHPQTQGKVERLHGCVNRELLSFNARRQSMELFLADRDAWQSTHNYLRPHEALADKPPISRYHPSPRPRPETVPPVSYPEGTMVRKVSQVGDVRYHRARISIARSLIGQRVRIEEREHDIAIYFSWKQLRVIHYEQLKGRRLNDLI